MYEFANAVYEKPGHEDYNVEGYTRTDYHDGEAALFVPDGEGVVVLAFRGTQSLYDAVTDLGILTKQRRVRMIKTPYAYRMDRMDRVARAVLESYRNVHFTGHSLGGHIAENLACKYNVPGTVFNKAAGLKDKGCRMVRSYRTPSDIVSILGRRQKKIGKRNRNPFKAHTVRNFAMY